MKSEDIKSVFVLLSKEHGAKLSDAKDYLGKPVRKTLKAYKTRAVAERVLQDGASYWREGKCDIEVVEFVRADLPMIVYRPDMKDPYAKEGE